MSTFQEETVPVQCAGGTGEHYRSDTELARYIAHKRGLVFKSPTSDGVLYDEAIYTSDGLKVCDTIEDLAVAANELGWLTSAEKRGFHWSEIPEDGRCIVAKVQCALEVAAYEPAFAANDPTDN